MRRIPGSQNFMEILCSSCLAKDWMPPENLCADHREEALENGHIVPVQRSVRERRLGRVVIEIQHENRAISTTRRDLAHDLNLSFIPFINVVHDKLISLLRLLRLSMALRHGVRR